MATKAAPITSRRMTVALTRPIEEVSVKRETMRHRMSVVKMEDRMGDYQEANTEESDDNEVEEEVDEDIIGNDEQDDESDDEQEEDDDDDDDDDNDKDYVGSSFFKQRQLPATTSRTRLNASTREQRAAKRQCRKSEMMEEDDTEEEEEEVEEQEEMKDVVQEVPVLKTTPKKRKPAKPRTARPKKKIPPQTQPHLQDYSNSDRFHELRYAFERVPAADLWYRVFSRQDACEERYYEYFGSTKYRKLPYELGPIPFDRTLDGICCKLCKTGGPIKTSNKSETGITAKRETETCNDVIKQEEEPPHTLNGGSSPTLSGNTASSSQYTHKHKKLHLLQRYRQEQHDLLQKQQMHHKEDQLVSLATAIGSTLKCDSKASTPERGRVGEQLLDRERERAESTHSNGSSCASSMTTFTKKQYRNKHLNKAAFLNLELPPRKSPREHASTLALVSCIIKQRQDSQSKSNSDMDEPPPTTPTTPTPTIKEEIKTAPAMVTVDAVHSPRNTRSAAATPVEELRFATEISENVKRLRRGQNKYDHSPPIVSNAVGRGSRGRGLAKSPLGRRLHHPQHRSQTPKNAKRRRRQMPAALHHSTNNKYHSYGGSGIGGINSQGTLASIRKTGSKKGVLEFDMDAAALKALDAATKHTNVRQLEWEIDKFMQLSGKDYDLDVDLNLEMVDATELVQPRLAVETLQMSTTTSTQAPQSPMDTEPPAMAEKSATPAITAPDWNTPPPTDYFSSDFDLCDLFANARTAGNSENDQLERKRKGFSLYNSVALHNYFRKRKNLKSNRTGWPKVQKKKSSVRQQQMLHQKIRFLQSIGEANGGQAANPAEEPAAEAKEPTEQQPTRDSTVITPPDSEVDECDEEDAKTNVNDDEEEEEVDDDDSQLDAFESIPEEEGDDEAETMLGDSNDEEEEDTVAREADVDAAADADEEEEDEGDADEDDDYDAAPVHKHTLRSAAASPAEKFQSNFLQVPGITTTATATSTPSTQMLRCGLRRTPQLNGSLGSCISPSEKAGDNSDIFTVSSDGLDTDMDMSNSHSQLNHKPGDDDHHDQQQQHHCPNHTPKRKFDLAKYASNNSASNTYAAEAATAAVKSLAISQFLNKEVRVTCRRLRAPFRRFRYRR